MKLLLCNCAGKGNKNTCRRFFSKQCWHFATAFIHVRRHREEDKLCEDLKTHLGHDSYVTWAIQIVLPKKKSTEKRILYLTKTWMDLRVWYVLNCTRGIPIVFNYYFKLCQKLWWIVDRFLLLLQTYTDCLIYTVKRTSTICSWLQGAQMC